MERRRIKAYELFRRGELGFPAVRVGHRVIIPVSALCQFLGIDLELDQLVQRVLDRPV